MQRKSISHPWRELMPIKMLTHEGQSNDPNKIALAIYFWQWRIWTRIFGKPCRHQHLKGRQCSEQIHSSPKQRRQKPNNISSESGVFPLLLKNSFDEIWCFFIEFHQTNFIKNYMLGKKETRFHLISIWLLFALLWWEIYLFRVMLMPAWFSNSMGSSI